MALWGSRVQVPPGPFHRRDKQATTCPLSESTCGKAEIRRRDGNSSAPSPKWFQRGWAFPSITSGSCSTRSPGRTEGSAASQPHKKSLHNQSIEATNRSSRSSSQRAGKDQVEARRRRFWRSASFSRDRTRLGAALAKASSQRRLTPVSGS